MEYDVSYRIAVVGHEASGANTFIATYVVPDYGSEEMDFSIRYVTSDNGTRLKLKLWEPRLVGDQLRSPMMYFGNTSAIVFVYDICKTSTFDCIPSLVEKILEVTERFTAPRSLLFLAGIKSAGDREERGVSFDRASIIADRYGMRYFEIDLSTCSDELISKIFYTILNDIIEEYTTSSGSSMHTVEAAKN